VIIYSVIIVYELKVNLGEITVMGALTIRKNGVCDKCIFYKFLLEP